MTGSFTADAYIDRTPVVLPNRHQHDRTGTTFGEIPDTLVEITASMGLGILDRSNLHEALTLIHERLVILETP